MKIFFQILFTIPLILLIGLGLCNPIFAQDTAYIKFSQPIVKIPYYRIMFYNVENLFDTEDDSLKNDEEFLPIGIKGWTNSRYWEKIDHIYKTIVAVGEWSPPVIVGLCEIENRKVLYDLVNKSPLIKLNYQIIHEDSPDRRGVDVGMLYRSDVFRPLSHESMRIVFPFDTAVKTRDVLYVKGTIERKDTIHVFINHWPSRSGGQQQSEPRRKFVAEIIKIKTDSILKSNPKAHVIITGDFNDEPEDISIKESLKAHNDTTEQKDDLLINTMYPYINKGIGTEKYQGHWAILDQFIVSGNLINGNSTLQLNEKRGYIFFAEYLLEEDKRFMGMMPFRTYAGPRYLGGYSDHLPVFIDLIPTR